MTLAVAVVLFGILMLWAGIKGRSLKHALVGKSVAGGAGAVTQ